MAPAGTVARDAPPKVSARSADIGGMPRPPRHVILGIACLVLGLLVLGWSSFRAHPRTAAATPGEPRSELAAPDSRFNWQSRDNGTENLGDHTI